MSRSEGMRRAALAAGTLGSAVAAAVAVVWLIRPGSGMFDQDPQLAMLADAAGPHVATMVQAAAGLIGLATGIAGLARVLPTSGLVIASALQVLVFGVLLQSPMILNAAGYLVAFAMPAVGAILMVQLIRRYPVARWVVGLPALVAIAFALYRTREPIARLGGLMGPALAQALPPMLLTIAFALTAACWLVAAAATAAGTRTGTSAMAWIVRHRAVFTVIAACCLLPYGLARLTWFTPWPLLGGAGIDMPTRIWGIVLGSGAWLGFVLTLGLIRPWGEVFPRWMPFVAGRPVPIAAAAVPGGAVAAIACAAAIPWLYAAGRNVPTAAAVEASTSTASPTVDPVWHALEAALIFPCWLWGPTLALAVLGYVGHRQRHSETEPRNHSSTEERSTR